MAFQKKTWVDGPTSGTKLKAAELNRIEQGIADNTAAWDSVAHDSYQSGNLTVRALRWGRMVHVSAAELEVTGSPGTREASMQIDTKYIPATEAAWSGVVSNPDIVAWGKVAPNGVLRLWTYCRNAYGGETVELSMTYLAAY